MKSFSFLCTFFACLLLFAPVPIILAQTSGIGIEPQTNFKGENNGSFTIRNTGQYTASVTITVEWGIYEYDPKSGKDIYKSRQTTQATATVPPGQSRTAFASRPYGGKVHTWNGHDITFPYQAMEQAAKEREENRRRNPPIAPAGNFAGFLSQLKASGKEWGYYQGDSHYGPGYYDKNGRYLGKNPPADASPLVSVPPNPNDPDRGAPPILGDPDPIVGNAGQGGGGSGFTLTFGELDPRPQKNDPAPVYLNNFTPYQPSTTAPAWAFGGEPTTFTLPDGTVVYREPLPAGFSGSGGAGWLPPMSRPEFYAPIEADFYQPNTPLRQQELRLSDTGRKLAELSAWEQGLTAREIRAQKELEEKRITETEFHDRMSGISDERARLIEKKSTEEARSVYAEWQRQRLAGESTDTTPPMVLDSTSSVNLMKSNVGYHNQKAHETGLEFRQKKLDEAIANNRITAGEAIHRQGMIDDEKRSQPKD